MEQEYQTGEEFPPHCTAENLSQFIIRPGPEGSWRPIRLRLRVGHSPHCETLPLGRVYSAYFNSPQLRKIWWTGGELNP